MTVKQHFLSCKLCNLTNVNVKIGAASDYLQNLWSNGGSRVQMDTFYRVFAWFITIRYTLGCKFSQHLLEDNCTLGIPAALLRSGIIFRDYFCNTVSSVFVQDKITSMLNLQERREKQNEFISNQLCNQTVIQRILFFWMMEKKKKGEENFASLSF